MVRTCLTIDYKDSSLFESFPCYNTNDDFILLRSEGRDNLNQLNEIIRKNSISCVMIINKESSSYYLDYRGGKFIGVVGINTLINIK